MEKEDVDVKEAKPNTGGVFAVGDRQDYRIVGLAILFLLCWMGFSPLACRGAEVWSDDFNDGNYDGWTICDNPVYNSGSSWSAANQYLQINQTEHGIISHPSNVAYGRWSFDWRAVEAHVVTHTITSFVFISSNLDGDEWGDWTCYFLKFTARATSEGGLFDPSLQKNLNGTANMIVRSETPVPAGAWYHIDVSRNTAGLFSVYLNGSLIMQGTDTDIDTSELFVFYTEDWQMFDNVVVDDAPIIDWLPFVIIGATAVVIIAVLVIILRRR